MKEMKEMKAIKAMKEMKAIKAMKEDKNAPMERPRAFFLPSSNVSHIINSVKLRWSSSTH